ncbi:hypothetical protein F2Q70_00017295 [Brassica cretica]|uniref:Uncharacterized protein n=1 Tax=Brassica cretica TaxID=69181 RepID=A0A8S9I1E8_BRACR|nr:hypothetical protein F2Q70_00017295 [Brassica cretica]
MLFHPSTVIHLLDSFLSRGRLTTLYSKKSSIVTSLLESKSSSFSPSSNSKNSSSSKKSSIVISLSPSEVGSQLDIFVLSNVESAMSCGQLDLSWILNGVDRKQESPQIDAGIVWESDSEVIPSIDVEVVPLVDVEVVLSIDVAALVSIDAEVG